MFLSTGSTHRSLLYPLLTLFILVGTAILDFFISPGIITWTLYILAILITLTWGRPKQIMAVGMIAIILTALGYFFPQGDYSLPDIINQLSGIIVLSFVTFLSCMEKYDRESIKQTLRKNLSLIEKRERQFEKAVDAAPLGILTCDINGKIHMTNKELEKIFAYSPGELVGKTVETLVPSEVAAAHSEYRENFFKETQARQMGKGRILNGVRKDGSRIRIEIGLAPFETKEGPFVLAGISDVTEKKQMEELKEDFIQTFSHDLRTPITIIKGTISNLLDNIAGPLNEKQRSTLKIAERNTDSLNYFLKNLLEITRLESGKITLQQSELDFPSLLQKTRDNFLEMAKKRNIQILLECPDELPRVHADEEMMFEVLNNLISNSLRFARQQVTLTAIHPNPGHIQVTITDDGPGLEPEMIPKIFDKFQQFHRSKDERGYRGTGLGLAICKQILALHHGHIRAESPPEGGASFSFTLPRNP